MFKPKSVEKHGLKFWLECVHEHFDTTTSIPMQVVYMKKITTLNLELTRLCTLDKKNYQKDVKKTLQKSQSIDFSDNPLYSGVYQTFIQ